MAHTFLSETDKQTKRDRKFIFRKRFKKVCGNRKRMLDLHPAKRGKFIEKLTRLVRKEWKIYFQKNFPKSLPDKIKDVLLHPLWETSEVLNLKRFRLIKEAEHVPRHIELTAVLRAILKQK